MSNHSEEEYKRAIKLLKQKYLTLQDKQSRLLSKYQQKYEKIKPVPLDLALKIEDDELYPEIDFHKKHKKIYDFIPYENERLMRMVLNEIQNKGINYEMIYRMVDKEQLGNISVLDLRKFFMHRLKIQSLGPLELKNMADVFDEDCNGSISWDEFKTTLCRYSMNMEGDYLIDARNSDQETLIKITSFFKKRNLSAEQVFVSIYRLKNTKDEKTPFISGQDIQKYLEMNNINMKEMELYSLLRVMDPERKNQVRRRDFIRELSKITNEGKADLEIEMNNFKQYFKKSNLTPIQLFKFADKKGTRSISCENLASTISQFINFIDYDEALRYIRLIDSNENGDIDSLEFELSLLTTEDLDNFQVFSKNEVTQKERDEVMQKLKENLEDLDLNPSQLFKRLDRNMSGEISLIELRNGFLDLGYTMQEVILVMRIFDQNFDGSIQVQEFMTQFGEDPNQSKLLQTQMIAQLVNNDFELEKKQLIDAVKKLRRVFVAYYPGLSLEHQKLFVQFDKNKDGVLSRKEFLEGLDSLEPRVTLTEKQKQLLIEYVDHNEDNEIDFEEFASFLDNFNPKELKQERIRKKKLEQQLDGKPLPHLQNFLVRPETNYKEQYVHQGDQDQSVPSIQENDLDDHHSQDPLKLSNNGLKPAIKLNKSKGSPINTKQDDQDTKDLQEDDEEDLIFGEEEHEKGDQAGAMNLNDDKNLKNIDLKDPYQKDTDIEKHQQPQTQQQKQQLVQQKAFKKPKSVYIMECIGFIYILILLLICVFIVDDLMNNKGIEWRMFFRKKDDSDIEKLYDTSFNDDPDQKKIAQIILKNLNQYFPSLLDYLIVLIETVVTLVLFGFDLSPAPWKYILNICLLVKDGLTIIWLIKEESLDNYQSWTFSGFGYFLGRTFCSIPFFITITKIISLRLYIFQQKPTCIIKYLIKAVYIVFIFCGILGCMHFTIGFFIYAIPVFPLWTQFSVLFYFIYTYLYSSYNTSQAPVEQKQSVKQNEQLIWNFSAFSVKRCGVLALYSVLIPQIVMAGAIVSDPDANFSGFWSYFYSSALQVMTNVFSLNTQDFDFVAAAYRYLLGF